MPKRMLVLIVEILGVACVVAGFAVWYWPAALIVAGVTLVAACEVRR